VELVDGQVQDARVRTRGGTDGALPDSDLPPLLDVAPGNRPVTLDLPTLGAYRIVATRHADQVQITGLPEVQLQQTVTNLVTTELVVAAITLAIAGVIGAALVRRELEPLERVASTARRVSTLPLDRGEVQLAERMPDADPETEVGQVGAALNHMLDHVGAALEARQNSEMQLRQFIADASHELRTPLAAIRGYAELTRRGPLSEDATYSLSRISSQAERMTTLVEDLLLLARLDAGRPLERSDVDLTRLVLDAVSDAHAAGSSHRWQLDLPEEPVTVRGDASRLTQVITNLLANARTHTPPGTAVAVTLEAKSGTARVSVVDEGPGIPAELLPHVFERFARGSTSRSRENGSTGLGLAIVHAVVAAHGGGVSVTSRPGHTAFTVRLPMAEAEAGVLHS
jgi:two-component system OmpR family sensor kinase